MNPRGRKPRTLKATCPSCRSQDWLEKKNDTTQGYSLVCKPCKRKKDAEWKQANKARVKFYDRAYNAEAKKVWGTQRKPRPEFISLARSQGNTCAICGAKPKARRLAVDHDHKSGKIRGLLCMFCNTGLGKFRDSPELLERAIVYLEESK